MIDLHCHLLPGIDDGPPTVEAAVALARAAERAGTRTMVATPHVSWRYQNESTDRAALIERLQGSLQAAGVELEVRAGAEVAATRVAEIEPDAIARLTLGDGPWLLLEPPFTPMATGFDAIAYELMRQGHQIVIAHPERCAGLQREPEMLAGLVRSGALTSITAGSLVGRFGEPVRRFAMRLLEEGLVHNVASDAHDESQRPPGMAAEIERAGLGALREWLTELVPGAILSGDPIPARPDVPVGGHGRRGLLTRLRRS